MEAAIAAAYALSYPLGSTFLKSIHGLVIAPFAASMAPHGFQIPPAIFGLLLQSPMPCSLINKAQNQRYSECVVAAVCS